MPVMDIAERLRDRFGAQIVIPPKDPRNPWVRLDCPACKGGRAALNHSAGWLKCYRCKLDVSARLRHDEPFVSFFGYVVIRIT